MNFLKKAFRNAFANKKAEKGQGLVEYALILVLVSVVVIVVLMTLGPRIRDMLAYVAMNLDECGRELMACEAECETSGDFHTCNTNCIDEHFACAGG